MENREVTGGRKNSQPELSLWKNKKTRAQRRGPRKFSYDGGVQQVGVPRGGEEKRKGSKRFGGTT